MKENKFLKIRKITEKYKKTQEFDCRKLELEESFRNNDIIDDMRVKTSIELRNAIIELIALVTAEKGIDIICSKVVFLKTYQYACSLLFRKKDKNNEKYKSIKKTKQYKAFKRAEKILDSFLKVILEHKDPFIGYAPDSFTKNYLYKMNIFFDKLLEIQGFQSQPELFYAELGKFIKFDLAEEIIYAIYDDISSSNEEVNDLVTDFKTKKSTVEVKKISPSNLGWLPYTRKTLEDRIRKHRKKSGIGLKKRGRPRKL